MSEQPFFRDVATGKPCPRRGNVMCDLPYDPDHRHVWVGYESLTPSAADPAPAREGGKRQDGLTARGGCNSGA